MKPMFGQPPVARSSLAADLRRLGVTSGDTLLVHSSLRSLGGWICGGATTVVSALLDAIGPAGTLVVPSQSPECQDPARWRHLAVPDEWLDEVREHLPSFDPALTPTTMGAVAERVRTWPGAVRSPHPLTSFAGIGPRAAGLLAEHELPSLLGEESPLARLEEVDAEVLLLGVGYDRCTAFHLAEYRLPEPPRRWMSCLVSTPEGGRVWVDFETIDLDATEFGVLGKELEATIDGVRVGRVAGADARLLPLRTAVLFAQRRLAQCRARPRLESGTRAPASSPLSTGWETPGEPARHDIEG